MSHIHIKVLGMGNARHRQLSRRLSLVLQELDEQAIVEQVMDVDEILNSGAEVIPAVLVNGEVVFDGNQHPTRAELKAALMGTMASSAQ